jgi:hypothetical protein
LSPQDGDPKQFKFESISDQEQSLLKRVPKSHMGSILGVLYRVGRTISRRFQWHQSHAQIHLESSGISETIGRLEFRQGTMTPSFGL